MRLLFITDFTEQFAYRLLQGVLHYAEETEQWVVCKMPPAHKEKLGMKGVLDYAKRWRADVIIGQFDPDDDVCMLRDSGIGHETDHNLPILLCLVDDIQIARVYDVPDHRDVDQISHFQTNRFWDSVPVL